MSNKLAMCIANCHCLNFTSLFASSIAIYNKEMILYLQASSKISLEPYIAARRKSGGEKFF
jgi:hypothetical protein